MKSIWKFEFKIDDNVDIEMPDGAKILHVDIQLQRNPAEAMTHPMGREVPCIWASVDTQRPLVERNFFVAGTGNPLPNDMPLEHLGSFKMQHDMLVWHLFEKIRKQHYASS